MHEAQHEIARMKRQMEVFNFTRGPDDQIGNYASDYTINDNLKPRITMIDELGKADTSLYPKPKYNMTDDERAPPEVVKAINEIITTLTIKR